MRKIFSQKGRTLVEMIGVIVLMAIISLAVYALLYLVVGKANTKALEQEIQTRVVQLRHQALTKSGIKVETNARIMEASGMAIRTLEVGDTTFTLRVGSGGKPLDYATCQRLMKSASFSPENSDACHENQTYSDFTFPKFGNLKKFAGGGSNIMGSGIPEIKQLNCGDHAHQSGNRCMCDVGYGNWHEGIGCNSEIICDSNASLDEGTCRCDAGYYGDGYTCYPCPDGQYSARGASFCTPCGDRAKLNSDHTECICVAGSYGNGEVCTQCGDRQYSDEDASACSTCPAGQTHNSDHTGCENCTDTTTLGACGCGANEVPDGNGGCTENKVCTSNSECTSEGTCMGCVIPNGKTNGTCQFACTYKDYLQGTGSQYIDTGIKPSSNTKVQVKFMYTAWNGYTFIGRYNTVVERDSFRFFNAGSSTYLDYGSGDGYSGRINVSNYITSTSKIYETEFGNHYIKDLTSGQTKASGSQMSFGQKNYTIALWAYSSEKGRIYYCKIYDGNNLVRDFVPVLDPNGTPAMLDKVENVLYYNKGSGRFTTN